MPRKPSAFLSSTSEDLREHREQAARAIEASGLSVERMEYWPVSGARPSLDECLVKVDGADVVVVLVAHRYGWAPEDPRNTEAKSITWLECQRARECGKEVLAILVDPNTTWPAELKESFRLVSERRKAGIQDEVERNETKLEAFKTELSRFVRSQFTDAASVRALVGEALSGWKERHPSAAPVHTGDPEPYLKQLEEENRQIRIRGLRSRRAEPYFFGIDEIWIELTTLSAPSAERQTKTLEARQPEQRRIELQNALRERRTVVIGDPGSGKSTFVRRTAFELCRNLRGTRPEGAPPFMAGDDRRFPILIRAAELTKLLTGRDLPSKPDESPDWIPWFLGRQNEDYQWGLDAV